MIRVYPDLEQLSLAAADRFARLADRAVRERGHFTVVLSGGSTPRRLYEILAASPFRQRIPWDAVHLFWGDERCVPVDDPRSNARMVRQALLDFVCIPAGQVHPMTCAETPDRAAVQYESVLETFFDNHPPVFDLVLLGLGTNAHTASLFPHAPVLAEKKRWVCDVYVPEQKMHRLTLTPPIINQARCILFLVSGSEKAFALQRVLEGPLKPDMMPAQLIRPTRAEPIWLVDQAAASRLPADKLDMRRTIMRVGIAADHGGFELKTRMVDVLGRQGYTVVDFGAEAHRADDDYPDFVLPLARAVAAGEVERGIAVCGSGVGASIAANKVPGARAGLIHDGFSAHQGVEDDNLNIICLGGRVIGQALAEELVQIFLNARFSGADRHRRRLAKVAAMENTR